MAVVVVVFDDDFFVVVDVTFLVVVVACFVIGAEFISAVVFTSSNLMLTPVLDLLHMVVMDTPIQ